MLTSVLTCGWQSCHPRLGLCAIIKSNHSSRSVSDFSRVLAFPLEIPRPRPGPETLESPERPPTQRELEFGRAPVEAAPVSLEISVTVSETQKEKTLKLFFYFGLSKINLFLFLSDLLLFLVASTKIKSSSNQN